MLKNSNMPARQSKSPGLLGRVNIKIIELLTAFVCFHTERLRKPLGTEEM